MQTLLLRESLGTVKSDGIFVRGAFEFSSGRVVEGQDGSSSLLRER